jgi:hypothetical protein
MAEHNQELIKQLNASFQFVKTSMKDLQAAHSDASARQNALESAFDAMQTSMTDLRTSVID